MDKTHSILKLSDEAFGWFLAGLVDGEGYFCLVNKANQNRKMPQRSMFASLRLSMRDDETPGLEAIAARMQCGSMYFNHRGSKLRESENPTATWIVHSRDELAGVIVPFFERFPLQMKKARDFAIWKQAVAIIKKKRHKTRPYTEDDWAMLEEHWRQITAVRKYVPRGGHTNVAPPRPPITNGQLTIFPN